MPDAPPRSSDAASAASSSGDAPRATPPAAGDDARASGASASGAPASGRTPASGDGRATTGDGRASSSTSGDGRGDWPARPVPTPHDAPEAPPAARTPLAPPEALPTTLDGIRAPVEAELAHFQRYFREAMRSEHALLDTITQYVLSQKGKRIRPLLVLLSAKALGRVNEASYRAAALVELLHTATLVHDDVVDDAERRRGVFSINALWKNKVAVLLGDFLLSRGLLLSLGHRDYAVLHALSDAVRRMSEGELLQIEKARLLDIDEATYFRIISDKTASLIAACTTAGALSTTDDEAAVARMRQMGETLGLAFQIRDDLFDFGVKDVGKPIGIDLQEKKLTLPLIVALRRADERTRRRIMQIVRRKKKSRDDIRAVAAFVTEHGGIAYAQAKMDALADEARTLLETLPPSPARDALAGLTAYTVKRRV